MLIKGQACKPTNQNRKLKSTYTYSWALATWNKTDDLTNIKVQNHMIIYTITSQSRDYFLELGMCWRQNAGSVQFLVLGRDYMRLLFF